MKGQCLPAPPLQPLQLPRSERAPRAVKVRGRGELLEVVLPALRHAPRLLEDEPLRLLSARRWNVVCVGQRIDQLVGVTGFSQSLCRLCPLSFHDAPRSRGGRLGPPVPDICGHQAHLPLDHDAPTLDLSLSLSPSPRDSNSKPGQTVPTISFCSFWCGRGPRAFLRVCVCMVLDYKGGVPP